MVNKRFLVFRIATFLALLIALCVFLLLSYLVFKDKTLNVKGNKDILLVSLLFFLLLISINFQVQNIRLLAYLHLDEPPKPFFSNCHAILLVFNCFVTIGVGFILYLLISDLYAKNLNRPAISYIILWLCMGWFSSNLITVIDSLHLRTYLHIKQIRKEKLLLESIGTDL